MQEAAALAVEVAASIDVTDVNFNIEPNFDECGGDAVKYEIKAESVCIDATKEFLSQKTSAALAQAKKVNAFKPLIKHLCILKAVKLGLGGRGSEWGDTVKKLEPLKIRTVDRWIAKALSEGNIDLPLWVVKRLGPTIEPSEGKPKKIEFTPLSLQERKAFMACLTRLTFRRGPEKAWQVIFEAITLHPDAQVDASVDTEAPQPGEYVPSLGTEVDFMPKEKSNDSQRRNRAFVDDDSNDPTGPETILADFESRQPKAEGATE